MSTRKPPAFPLKKWEPKEEQDLFKLMIDLPRGKGFHVLEAFAKEHQRSKVAVIQKWGELKKKHKESKSGIKPTAALLKEEDAPAQVTSGRGAFMGSLFNLLQDGSVKDYPINKDKIVIILKKS